MQALLGANEQLTCVATIIALQMPMKHRVCQMADQASYQLRNITEWNLLIARNVECMNCIMCIYPCL